MYWPYQYKPLSGAHVDLTLLETGMDALLSLFSAIVKYFAVL
jgi:hypothetical protein